MPPPPGGGPATPVLREQVHQTTIKGQLFRRVIVVLIGGGRLRAVQTERVVAPAPLAGFRFGLRRQQPREAIDARRVGQRGKLRFARGVGGDRVGAEVVVEGNVLLEDHDQVTDGSCR